MISTLSRLFLRVDFIDLCRMTCDLLNTDLMNTKVEFIEEGKCCKVIRIGVLKSK